MSKSKSTYIFPSEDFGGFEWLGESDPTPTQLRLVHFLAIVRKGTHHFRGKVNARGRGIVLTCPSDANLATYDSDDLTSLVLWAHAWNIRVEIHGIAPGYVRIYCTQRHPKVDGDFVFDRHPGLVDLIDKAQSLLIELQKKVAK